MKPFSTSENPEEAGQLWVKWKKELLTRFRFFCIDSVQDCIDAISIYGGELIRELIDTLQDVPIGDDVEHNDFDKCLAKLDNYFVRITNSNSGRSKFAEMFWNKGESVAQYHFRPRFKAAKCNFPDTNYAALQTMIDGRLRQEAMVKRYSLKELLKYAANKDVDQERQNQLKQRRRQKRPPCV